MIIGQFNSKLTEKYRLSIPKKFREELGDKLVVSRWYENCLVLVSIEGWSRLLNRVTGKSGIITSPVRDVDRFVLGSAYEINLDAQGRFVLPEILMVHSGMKSEAVFVGLGDRVEIWSRENWDKLGESIQRKADKAIEKLARK